MPITADLVQRTLKGFDRPDRPHVTIPPELLLFTEGDCIENDFMQVWNAVNAEKLRNFLRDSQDGGVEGGIDFHLVLGSHIAEILPFVSKMNTLLCKDSNGDPGTKNLYGKVVHRLIAIQGALVDQATPKPIQLNLDLPRTAKKNKSKGKSRPAPETSMAIAIPFLELFNGIVTQKFSEAELSSVIAQITGYSQPNISTYRFKKLSVQQKRELISILNDVIHSIEASIP